MVVFIADSCKSTKWIRHDVYWEDFVNERLYTPHVTNETFEIYEKLDNDEKILYKDCGGYIFGELDGGSRAKKNIKSRCALLLDLDYAPLNAWELVTSKFNVEMVMHSTHSHCSENPRYRLIVPLNRECTPDEYECVARTFAFNIGMEYFDKTTFQRNRLMYFPSCSIDAEYVFEWNRSSYLNVDSLLSLYADWTDMRSWAYHPDERKIHEGTGKERQNPLEYDGIIGAYNRTFSIEDTIRTFLSDIYRIDGDGVFTYLKGSSACGAKLYEDVWIYSHHATDPAQGRLLSSFELLMCHKFNDDLRKATKFIATIPEVKRTVITDTLSNFEAIPIQEGELEQDWFTGLELDKAGKIAGNYKNVRLIFENDINLKDVFKYNEFNSVVFLTKKVPWRMDIPEDGDTIRNVDFPCLYSYFGIKYEIPNTALIDNTLLAIAYDNKYHPIRNYITSLEWDGKPRIETALIDYFAVEDNIYTREVFRKTLVGAIMRAFNAGCKHDTILVIVGKEGTCKSDFLKRLGMGWFSDTFDTSTKEKALFEQLQGKWIIEIAEIDRLSRNEVGQVKYFTSKRVDSFRPAFGHVLEDYPRQCVFIGTTNEVSFLRSENGNRRFYPVMIANGMKERGEQISEKYVYTDFTPYEVDQMWAEAFYMFISGENNVLSKEAIKIVDGDRQEFEEQSVLTGEIERKLEYLVPDNFEEMSIDEATKWFMYPDMHNGNGTMPIERVCGLQLWVEVLGKSRESFGKMQQYEMTSAIKKSTLIDSNSARREYSNRYGRQRFYKLKRNVL